jgi:hypothetical protein
MSWRSWLFPNPRYPKIEKIVRESALAADAVMRPLEDLELSIVTAADTCAKRVKPYLRSNPELDAGRPDLQVGYIYVFYEFLYFFLHMMNREAYQRMGRPDKVKLQELVGPSIRSVAVDAFFGHWPEKFKSGMRNSFYEKLNDAEMEYATCKTLVSNTSPIDDTALCSRLAKNVLMLAGYGADTEELSAESAAFAKLVQRSALEVLNNMNLGELVARAGAVVLDPKNAKVLSDLHGLRKGK